MPSESKAACCIAPDSEWATGWPIRTTRFVMLAPFRGRRRNRDRRSRRNRAARWSCDRRRPAPRSRTSWPVGGRRGCRSRCPWSRAPPWIRRSSPSTSTRAPRARRPAVTPAIRSDSLWRSSPAPRIVVGPSARAAARHRIGISSMAAATSCGDRSMPCSSDERTVRSASGSPIPSSGPAWGRSLEVRAHAGQQVQDRRAGSGSRRRRAGSARRPDGSRPATSQNAAAETSPGTRSSIACTVVPPRTVTTAPPSGPRLADHVHPTGPKHPFRVIAGRHRLAHRRRTLGSQPGEQDRRLHLRARDRRRVVDRPERAATDHGQGRQGVVVARLESGPHGSQRFDDTSHRTASQ